MKIIIRKDAFMFLISLAIGNISCKNQTASAKPLAQNEKLKITHSYKDTLEYYTYGLMSEPYYDRASKVVWAKYGVKQVWIAGCIIDSTIEQTAKQHNDSLFQQLNKKFPGITIDKVLQEMQSYVTTTKTLEAIAMPELLSRLKQMRYDGATYITWNDDSTALESFLVDMYAVRENKPDTLLWHLKINPSAGSLLVKNNNEEWVEE